MRYTFTKSDLITLAVHGGLVALIALLTYVSQVAIGFDPTLGPVVTGAALWLVKVLSTYVNPSPTPVTPPMNVKVDK